MEESKIFRPLVARKPMMKLSKQQVLDLVKVLSHYETFDQVHAVNVPYGDLLIKFEEFLTSDKENELNEKANKNEKASKVSSGQANKTKFLKQEDEESDETDDGSEELDEESDREDEEVIHDDYLAASSFRDLRLGDSFKCHVLNSDSEFPRTSFKMNFCYNPNYKDLWLILNSSDDSGIGHLEYINRKAKSIFVAHEHEGQLRWDHFSVNKFPKSLTKLLPCNKMLKILDK